jgi:hypothetical protein
VSVDKNVIGMPMKGQGDAKVHSKHSSACPLSLNHVYSGLCGMHSYAGIGSFPAIIICN